MAARSSTARRNACSSRRSSRPRPTRGESSLRANPGAPATTASSRHAETGSAFPFKESGSRGSTSTAFLTRRCVASPIRISPGLPEDSSRCATTTASPVAKDCPSAASPATTSPVLMPVRTASSMPNSRRSSSFSSASASRSSAAARTARRASSSCTTGTPKTAITASPMNFSTVPPWCSRTRLTSMK